MAFKEVRDSWNVWREKVNRAIGNVEEIDADEVVYDNTTSGLTATDVQAAIDEVVGDIPVVPTTYAASDVTYDNTTSGLAATTAQAAIDELSIGGYQLIEQLEEKYSAQSGDSYSDMIDAVMASMQTKVNALDEKTVIVPCALTITQVVTLVTRNFIYAKNDTFNVVSYGVSVYSDQFSVWSSVGYSGTGVSTCHRATTVAATGVTTITDIGSITSTTGKDVILTYYIYKKP